mgnify:CR=1 FL=1
MNYFFTADEHYGHENIIKYCDRPFKSVEEMDEEIIKRHNEVVGPEDTVYHVGDFCMSKDYAKFDSYRKRLMGLHYFLKGNHDTWYSPVLSQIYLPDIMEENIEGQDITLFHYAMRVWNKSHHGSWQLFGHSHGKLPPIGKQLDVGVDTHDFYPYSFEEIKEIMSKKEIIT